MTDGLNVINLADKTVYTFQNPASADEPVGSEPDSAAADPSTGVIVVPSEGNGSQSVIDLSKATFDGSGKIVTAPTIVVPDLSYEGVAIEPASHIAFFEAEFSSTVAVMALPDALAGNAKPVQGDMPALPTQDSWSNIGDPHGIAVTAGISDSRPVGFVVNEARTWVGRVDLQKALAIPVTGSNFVDISSAVTYLDARTKR